MHKRGVEIYIVGGAIRDFLLNKKVKDLDFTGPYYPNVLEKIINEIFEVKKILKTKFLTVNFLTEGFTINFAHFRKEFYPSPAVLPEVRREYLLEKDAVRRDFTINSLYLGLHDIKLYDPLGGIEDLGLKILRVNYSGSFKDDPTRIFRAIRYKNKLGLKYSKELLQEVRLYKHFINRLSYQRIINELKRIAVEEYRVDMLKEVIEWKLLPVKEKVEKSKLDTLNKLLSLKEETWIYFACLIFKESFLDKLPLTRKERRICRFVLNFSPDVENYLFGFQNFSSRELKVLGIVLNDIENFNLLSQLKELIEDKEVSISFKSREARVEFIKLYLKN